jgi:hypothetical protein
VSLYRLSRHRKLLRLPTHSAIDAYSPDRNPHSSLTRAGLHLPPDENGEFALLRVVERFDDLLAAGRTDDDLVAGCPWRALEGDGVAVRVLDLPGTRGRRRDGEGGRQFLVVNLVGGFPDGSADGLLAGIELLVRPLFCAGDVCQKRSEFIGRQAKRKKRTVRPV